MKFGVKMKMQLMYGTHYLRLIETTKFLPAGMNALEMVRIEAGFIQPNADFMSAEQALSPNRMRNHMNWVWVG